MRRVTVNYIASGLYGRKFIFGFDVGSRRKFCECLVEDDEVEASTVEGIWDYIHTKPGEMDVRAKK